MDDFYGKSNWENDTSAVVGFHYSNCSIWDKSKDYSGANLSSDWVATDNIIVEDSDGNILWGSKSQ